LYTWLLGSANGNCTRSFSLAVCVVLVLADGLISRFYWIDRQGHLVIKRQRTTFRCVWGFRASDRWMGRSPDRWSIGAGKPRPDTLGLFSKSEEEYDAHNGRQKPSVKSSVRGLSRVKLNSEGFTWNCLGNHVVFTWKTGISRPIPTSASSLFVGICEEKERKLAEFQWEFQ
jgi:hypothetical protein